jgi:hypothetical protein
VGGRLDCLGGQAVEGEETAPSDVRGPAEHLQGEGAKEADLTGGLKGEGEVWVRGILGKYMRACV